MKKSFLIVAFSLISAFALAQENAGKRIITDTFDDGRLQWDEYILPKVSSVLIKNGVLEIKCEQDGTFTTTITELPIVVEDNFTIDCKFASPDVNEKNLFGIIFNCNDNEFDAFVVREGYAAFLHSADGLLKTPSRQNNIILKKGKKADVSIRFERVGNKLSFLVNDIDFKTITKPIINSTFGFITVDKSILNVDEISITQMIADEQ